MQETEFVKRTFNAKGWNSYIEKINLINDYDLKEPFSRVQATKVIGMTIQQLKDGKLMIIATDTGIFVKNFENLQMQVAFF